MSEFVKNMFSISRRKLYNLQCRKLKLSKTNVGPFVEATTISSTCNKVFRRNFLKPHTVGIIPRRGYRWSDNQSKFAIQWFVWEEKITRINIQHAAKNELLELKSTGIARTPNKN